MLLWLLYFTKKGEGKHCCGIVVRSKDYKVFFENVCDAVDEIIRYIEL